MKEYNEGESSKVLYIIIQCQGQMIFEIKKFSPINVPELHRMGIPVRRYEFERGFRKGSEVVVNF